MQATSSDPEANLVSLRIRWPAPDRRGNLGANNRNERAKNPYPAIDIYPEVDRIVLGEAGTGSPTSAEWQQRKLAYFH